MKTKVKIVIPRGSKVFVLDDDERRLDWFRSSMGNGNSLMVAHSADTAIKALANNQFDFVFLDHDLGDISYGYIGSENTGKDVARYLSGTGWVGDNVIIHSWNPAGAAQMKDLLEGAAAIPFGQFEIVEG